MHCPGGGRALVCCAWSLRTSPGLCNCFAILRGHQERLLHLPGTATGCYVHCRTEAKMARTSSTQVNVEEHTRPELGKELQKCW
jgi:hypothetical protein